MKPTEAVILTEYVKSCCPQQARFMGEYTPDAWHDLLGDLELADCRQAVIAVANRQPFVAPAEIRAEVRRIRAERIAHSVIEAPPAELADNPREYQRALQENIRKAADGHGIPASRAHLAITGASPMERGGSPPVSLRAALADVRKAIGSARFRRRPVDPQAIAAEQVAEARKKRGEVA